MKKVVRSKPFYAVAKAVSKLHEYNFSSKQCIDHLKKIQLKKRTFSKMNWGVKACNDCRELRLCNLYEECIFKANLNDLANLDKKELEESMCYFLDEVTKSKGSGQYLGKTLYEMCVSIQKYLNVNKIGWKIVDGVDFQSLRTVLDNLMKERTLENLGVVVNQAEVITYEYEEKLWRSVFWVMTLQISLDQQFCSF